VLLLLMTHMISLVVRTALTCVVCLLLTVKPI
jgi:hypothetical protein